VERAWLSIEASLANGESVVLPWLGRGPAREDTVCHEEKNMVTRDVLKNPVWGLILLAAAMGVLKLPSRETEQPPAPPAGSPLWAQSEEQEEAVSDWGQKPMPEPRPGESTEQYLKRATELTGIAFLCPAEYLKVPGDFLRSSRSVQQFGEEWARQWKTSCLQKGSWVILSGRPPEATLLTGEQEFWESVVAGLEFINSFSREQIEEMARQGGLVPFTSLTPEQQKQLWELDRSTGVISDLQRGIQMEENSFDITKLQISVCRTASMRLRKPDGEIGNWLGLFDYTAKGLQVGF